jgi:hypothetical protein
MQSGGYRTEHLRERAGAASASAAGTLFFRAPFE